MYHSLKRFLFNVHFTPTPRTLIFRGVVGDVFQTKNMVASHSCCRPYLIKLSRSLTIYIREEYSRKKPFLMCWMRVGGWGLRLNMIVHNAPKTSGRYLPWLNKNCYFHNFLVQQKYIFPLKLIIKIVGKVANYGALNTDLLHRLKTQDPTKSTLKYCFSPSLLSLE